MKREQVTKEGCKNCPYFQNTEHIDNMVKYNICHKRSTTGCYDD